MKISKTYKILLMLAVSVVMQSCFTAKSYLKPLINSVNLYRTEQENKDSVSLASVSWDKLFTDSVLQEHIKKGLQNNFDVRIALQNITAAEATMKQGKAGYFPTLNAGVDWTHQELSKNSQFGALLADRSTDQYQLTGTLSWEADIWGKIRSNKRATNASFLQTVAATQAIRTQVIASIASTYYQLMALDAQLKIANSTLDNRNQSIETIKALKDAGNVNEVGVKQTEAQLYTTQLIIEDLKTNIVVLENTLSILLGQSPQNIQRSTLGNQSMNPEIKLGVPALLLSKRPDVIAAEYNLINNFEMTNVARSSFYPTLKVTATGGFQSIDLKEWFSANSLFANVVSGLTQPIFNQRQIKTRYEIAKSNQQKAYLQFEQSLLIAGKEVSDALQQYGNETKKLEIRTKQVEALTLAAGYSDELLANGFLNYLEVLTAKDNALNSQLSLIDNQYQQYNAIIQLYKALGGGWQ